MSAVSGKANRLRLIAVAALVCGSMATPALAQRGAPAPGPSAAEALELGVLPTMKGHMGRLGTLMNLLFRSIDEPDETAAVLAAIDEMKLHLERVGETLLPDTVSFIMEPSARRAATEGYKRCVDRSITQLEEIAVALRGDRFPRARQLLLQLDQLRRDCHSKYGAAQRPLRLTDRSPGLDAPTHPAPI